MKSLWHETSLFFAALPPPLKRELHVDVSLQVCVWVCTCAVHRGSSKCYSCLLLMTKRRPKIKRENGMFIGFRKEAILQMRFKRLMHFPVLYLPFLRNFTKHQDLRHLFRKSLSKCKPFKWQKMYRRNEGLVLILMTTFVPPLLSQYWEISRAYLGENEKSL